VLPVIWRQARISKQDFAYSFRILQWNRFGAPVRIEMKLHINDLAAKKEPTWRFGIMRLCPGETENPS